MKVLHRLALFRWIAVVGIGMALTSVADAQTSRISVMINSVSNKGCFDQFLFCRKPDMVVSVTLRQLDGVRVRCPDTAPVVDRDNISTLASCSSRLVDGPVDVVIAISDVDQSHLTDTPIPINKQFNMAPAGSNRNETEAAFQPFQTVVPVLYRGVDADILFTVTTTPVPPVFKSPTLSLSRPSFDPGLGERVLFSNRLVLADDTSTDYPSTTPMNVVVIPPGGAPLNLVTGATINKFFNLDWDGKINGQRAPNGIYTIQTRLNSGGVSSAQVQVTSVPTVFEVSPPTVAAPWNPRAGPLSFPYRLSPQAAVTTRVEGPAAAGSACTAGALPIAVPPHAMNLNAGSGVLDVELKGMNGIFLPSGNYCA
ncbi:hypothetical protein LP415_08485 [Polaromonas sp. P1(28)-8]|nr:hypothetical protein LP415_08485 [Polaromonas sp. P1(28)-8]